MIPGKTQNGSFNSMFHCELFCVAAWRLSGGNDCFDDAELFRIVSAGAGGPANLHTDFSFHRDSYQLVSRSEMPSDRANHEEHDG